MELPKEVIEAVQSQYFKIHLGTWIRKVQRNMGQRQENGDTLLSMDLVSQRGDSHPCSMTVTCVIFGEFYINCYMIEAVNVNRNLMN